jgi:Flp pilus assembly protein TadB
MGFIATLWAPILLSAVFVFVASSLIHMLLKYHANDMRKLPNEDAIMDALRPFKLAPGDYFLPRCNTTKEMKSPEFDAKLTKGPVIALTVFKSGPISMGKSMVLWFLYCVVVNVFAAYIAWHAVQPGSSYLSVFRFIGCSAFMGYSLALFQQSIWYGRSWSSVLKTVFDGLIFGLITAGTFGWLWPR